jgi:hypothetical protein
MSAHETWPRLSRTLEGERHPEKCQSCGEPATAIWAECNDRDQVQEIFVALCSSCSDRLIKPHPRLYHRLEEHRPYPGTMGLCVNCRHRRGLTCKHPDKKTNGEVGLEIHFPKPTPMHLNFGGGKGAWMNLYPGPATFCGGREESAAGEH